MLIYSQDIGFCKYLLNFGYTFAPIWAMVELRISTGYSDWGSSAKVWRNARILRVVVQAHHGLDLAAADSEPVFELIVGNGPIQTGMPFAQLAHIAVIYTCAPTRNLSVT